MRKQGAKRPWGMGFDKDGRTGGRLGEQTQGSDMDREVSDMNNDGISCQPKPARNPQYASASIISFLILSKLWLGGFAPFLLFLMAR